MQKHDARVGQGLESLIENPESASARGRKAQRRTWATPVLAAAMVLVAAGYCAWGSPIAPLPSATSLQTEHYDLYVEGTDATDTGAMLEQLHAQLRQYFGTAPQGRLPLAIYASRQRWAEAMRADGQPVPEQAGGYYSPLTHKAYLWHQPSAYFTRHLTLHEATHQFHWLVATGNLAPSALWYTEGLADYFGMHNWDGKRLQTGVIPAVTLEDYPATARRNYEACGRDLPRMLPGAGRPESWALVSFLTERYPAQFRALRARLDRREDTNAAWRLAFGDGPARLSGEFDAWLIDHAQPWRIVWASWQQRGEAIEGDSRSVAMTLLKRTPRALAVELALPAVAGAAGLVFAFQSEQDFHLLQITADRKARVLRRYGGSWQPVCTKDLSAGSGKYVVAVAQEGDRTVARVDGQAIASVPSVGQVGLDVDACRANFRIMDLAP